jgi:hypothetical protein
VTSQQEVANIKKEEKNNPIDHHQEFKNKKENVIHMIFSKSIQAPE